MAKKTKNRLIFRQLHLWLGLASGLIVFIISITGCIYVFEEEIREATQHDRLYVPAEQKPFIGMAQIVGSLQQLAPKEKITAIRITESVPNATVEVSTKNKIYYLNPYNAKLVYQGKTDWLDTVEDIHTSLLLGETGKFIQRWSVVVFGIMLITGIVIWFPNQLRLLRQSLTIKWRASFKRVNYDLHQVLGFYASWFLIISVLTGLFFAFKEVKNTVSFVTGDKLSDGKKMKNQQVPPVETQALRYAHIYNKALAQYPGVVSSNLTVRKTGELRLRLIYPYNWYRKSNTFFYEEKTGLLLRQKLYKDFNKADLVEATNRELHIGALFGLPGKIVAFLVSLIAASLPVTGFMIWLNKKKKGKKKSGKPALA